MIKTIYKISLFISLFSILVSCVTEKVTGSGNFVSESRTVESFTSIANSGSATINVQYGNTQNLTVVADDNILSDVVTRVEDSQLSVELGKNQSFHNVSLTVNITLPDLNRINNTGSGKFTISGFENLNSLIITNSGSGKMNLKGSTKQLSIENVGSGKFYGFDFVSENCTINNSGSGKFEVNCSGELVAKNTGSGKVYYKGKPSISFENSGSGKIVDAN